MDLIGNFIETCAPVYYYKECYPHMMVVKILDGEIYVFDSATHSTVAIPYQDLQRFYLERERSERTPLGLSACRPIAL